MEIIHPIDKHFPYKSGCDCLELFIFSSKRRAWLLQEFNLLGGALATEYLVAVWEAPETFDDHQMVFGVFQILLIWR